MSRKGLPYGPDGCALSEDEVHSRIHSFSRCAADIGNDVYSCFAYLSLGPSILTEATYVSPLLAPFLATQLQFEIALCGLDVPEHSFLADPRIDDFAGPPQYLHSDPQPGVVSSRAESPLFQEPGVSMGGPPVDPDVGGLFAMAKTPLAQDVAVKVLNSSELGSSVQGSQSSQGRPSTLAAIPCPCVSPQSPHSVFPSLSGAISCYPLCFHFAARAPCWLHCFVRPLF